MGEGTKIVLSGDIGQIDSPYLDSSSNGSWILKQCTSVIYIAILAGMKFIHDSGCGVWCGIISYPDGKRYNIAMPAGMSGALHAGVVLEGASW